MSLADVEQLAGRADFKRDRWGRPLVVPAVGGKPVAYTRASSAAKPIEETYNLELWARRNVAYGLAADPSLVARVLAVGGAPHEWSDNDKKTVNRVVDDAADIAQAHRAANIGTALHAIIERVNRGEPVGDVGIFQPDVDAYRQAIAQAGWTINPEHVECRMVCDELRMAGTCDSIINDTDGYAIADLKTGSSVIYGALGYAAQLAAYAHSDLYDPATDTRTPIDINRKTGYLIHLPAGTGVCTIYQVDLVAGYDVAVLANQVRAMQKAAKGWLTAVDLSTSPGAGLVDNLRERVRTLVDLGHRDNVVWRWPEGVPGFASDHVHTLSELERIERALVAVENQVGAPFNPPPLTPKPSRRQPVEPVTVEPVTQIDDGDMVDADELAALQDAVEQLSDDERAIIQTVAKEANQAGYPISVAQKPCRRRWLIADALRIWCAFGWDNDVIDAALTHIDAPSADTLGGRIGQLTSDQAVNFAFVPFALDSGDLVLTFTPNPTINIPERQAS